MKGSKELIEHYNKRKEELGEKATKLNMYLEGYAKGYRDRKKPTQSWIEKAKYELEHEEELSIERAYELGKIRGEKEQKAIDHSEEHLNWIIKQHEEWSSMFNPNNISFKEWIDKAMEE